MCPSALGDTLCWQGRMLHGDFRDFPGDHVTIGGTLDLGFGGVFDENLPGVWPRRTCFQAPLGRRRTLLGILHTYSGHYHGKRHPENIFIIGVIVINYLAWNLA